MTTVNITLKVEDGDSEHLIESLEQLIDSSEDLKLSTRGFEYYAEVDDVVEIDGRTVE